MSWDFMAQHLAIGLRVRRSKKYRREEKSRSSLQTKEKRNIG